MVVLGKVTEAYGIKGWLRIHPFGDDPLAWRKMPVWWVRPERDERAPWQPLNYRNARLQGDSLVASFVGLDDRGAAEGYRGWLVGVPKTALPQTADNEFYWADLIGLAVENAAGETLGTVRELLETGANDVLVVVDAAGRERLLPFVATVVLTVDRDARRIRVEWGSDW
jgi:16S rRNA processing protein RimM